MSTFDQAFHSDGSRREDASPQAQKDRCVDHIHFLTSRKNQKYEIIEHLSDEGYSGKNTRRPAYQKMWRQIASNTISFVVTTELSRIGRSVLDFLELVSHCEEHKVDLIVIGLDLDTSTAFGRVIVIILVALAQFEREMTSQRVKENALNRLLKDGKINGAAEILGLDRDPKSPGHFLVNHEELLKVEKILKLFLKFSSKKKVLEEAINLGITGKKGRKLTGHAVDTMLKNIKWRYKGLWYANKDNENEDSEDLPESKKYQVVKLPHGPLIDIDLLDQVQEKLSSTYENKKRSGIDRIYLLTHLLKWQDGATYYGGCAKNRQYHYYYCKGSGPNIRCEEIEQLIIERIKEYFRGSPTFKKLVEKAITQKSEEIPKIDREIETIENNILKLNEENESFRQHILTPNPSNKPYFIEWLGKEVEAIKEKKTKLENDLTLLKTKRQEILNNTGLGDLEKTARDFINRFDELTGIEKRNFIERMIAKIVLKEGNKIEIHVRWKPVTSETGMTESTSSESNGGSGINSEHG